jgi:hypothetical protein
MFSRPFVANFIPTSRYGAAIASSEQAKGPEIIILGGLENEYWPIDPYILKEESKNKQNLTKMA